MFAQREKPARPYFIVGRFPFSLCNHFHGPAQRITTREHGNRKIDSREPTSRGGGTGRTVNLGRDTHVHVTQLRDVAELIKMKISDCGLRVVMDDQSKHGEAGEGRGRRLAWE